MGDQDPNRDLLCEVYQAALNYIDHNVIKPSYYHRPTELIRLELDKYRLFMMNELASVLFKEITRENEVITKFYEKEREANG